jgi:Calcium-dependent channel, 7TM region, putative phosphate
MVICVDMGKLEQVPSCAHGEEAGGLAPSHHRHGHYPRRPLWTFLSCKPEICAYHAFFSPPEFLIIVYTKTASFVPFINRWYQKSPGTFNIIVFLLSPVAYKAFMFLLFSIIRGLSRYQGAATQSQLQGSLLARAFALVMILNLIIFTFIGVVFSAC